MEAATKLQRNMAAEKAAMSDLSHVFGAVITPHQGVCGDLAAWPQTVYITRLVRYLGVRLMCDYLYLARSRRSLSLRIQSCTLASCRRITAERRPHTGRCYDAQVVAHKLRPECSCDGLRPSSPVMVLARLGSFPLCHPVYCGARLRLGTGL